MYGDITNVECEIHDYTCNNWVQRNSNKIFKEKFGSRTTKTFDKASILRTSHVIRSVLHLKLEASSAGSVVFAEETYKEEKDSDKRLIIIIIIICALSFFRTVTVYNCKSNI